MSVHVETIARMTSGVVGCIVGYAYAKKRLSFEKRIFSECEKRSKVTRRVRMVCFVVLRRRSFVSRWKSSNNVCARSLVLLLIAFAI